MSNQKKYTYKDSGVDIEAGNEMVRSITSLVRETHNEAVLTDIGGFGGFFQPDFKEIDQPVLVSSVDGVGTKLIVAFKAEVYDTVGQDLVNHCVNDIAICGAEPLFFLDYFSTGKLEQHVGYQVVKGFSKACKSNGVALIGGETAEMPDIYKKGEFDLAGTVVGVVDKNNVIDGSQISEGDLLIGFPSNGIHTNGYSLARKVLFDHFDIDDYVDELGTTIAEELLKVHLSYYPLIDALKKIEGVHGFSHVTGGGIEENTRRIVPEDLDVSVDWNAWDRLPVFDLIQKTGNVPEEDMRQTFNLGIGLVGAIDPDSYDIVEQAATSYADDLFTIGKVTD